jgi:hypothetical protein
MWGDGLSTRDAVVVLVAVILIGVGVPLYGELRWIVGRALLRRRLDREAAAATTRLPTAVRPQLDARPARDVAPQTALHIVRGGEPRLGSRNGVTSSLADDMRSHLTR